MHEFESFLHFLQGLSYFDETFLYADEVRDFHSSHHLQGALVEVEKFKFQQQLRGDKDADSVCMDAKTGRMRFRKRMTTNSGQY